jgi:hypothetical protein
MKRTGQQRIDAIPAALERGEDFRRRVAEAAGDAVRCADLMAEAIAMDREARGMGVVGSDGRSFFEFERLQACYCLDAARAEYLRARGSNQSSAYGQQEDR